MATELTLSNIQKEAKKAAKILSIEINVTFDCGNAYVNVNGSNHAITSIVFDDNSKFSTIYTTKYKKEILDDNWDYTGEFEDCEEEVYAGNSLKTAIAKLKKYS